MRQRRLSSVTFVRYLVICSLVLIAFMLYFRIEEESLPLNITFSKTPSRKDLAELRTKNLSTPSQQLHSTKSSEYESYGEKSIELAKLSNLLTRTPTNQHSINQNVSLEKENDSNILQSGFELDTQQRLNTLHEACKKHGLDRKGKDSLHQPKGWEYFITEHNKTKIVWCNIFKSASTSWMYIFNRLAGFSEAKLYSKKIPPVTLARSRYPRPSNDRLVSTLNSSNVIGFLIARNPYERLISAYRDKIVGAFRNSFHDKLSKEIVVKYRHILPKNYRHSVTVPTFKEFVSYILDEYRAGKELDMHWTPAYSFCNPCQINLTHIIKFETFDRDTDEILEKAHLKHFLPRSRKLNQSKSKGSKQNSSASIDKYLNELTPNLRNGLLQLYGIDFDIFNYDKKENF